MSQRLANLVALSDKKRHTRAQLLALQPDHEYNDGRTKQCFADECDIAKIMARFDTTGTISHLTKHQGQYADFSDYDFFESTQKLTRGREIFDDLPAEIRREFNQSPAAFFAYVNDPKNIDDLRNRLPGLAAPGNQHHGVSHNDVDDQAALAAASEPASENTPPSGGPKPPVTTDGPEAGNTAT